jgi:hypothetical protein
MNNAKGYRSGVRAAHFRQPLGQARRDPGPEEMRISPRAGNARIWRRVGGVWQSQNEEHCSGPAKGAGVACRKGQEDKGKTLCWRAGPPIAITWSSLGIPCRKAISRRSGQCKAVAESNESGRGWPAHPPPQASSRWAFGNNVPHRSLPRRP